MPSRATCARAGMRAARSRSARASSRSTSTDGRVVGAQLGRGAARARARRGAHAARERGRRRPARARQAARALPRARASEARGAAGARRPPDGARPARSRRCPSARTARRPRARSPASRSCSSRSCAQRPATREPFGALLLRTLQLARYDPVNIGHAALASPAYVHFTSPIRRYPDIVVHRAACALAGLGEEAPKARDLPEVALRCSQREREAADAERRADAICLAFLLQDTLRRDGWHQSFDGVVTGLIGAGLFVRFGDIFEGFLPARRLDARERFDSRRARRGAGRAQLRAAHPPRRRALGRRDRRRSAARARDARRRARARAAAAAHAARQGDDPAPPAEDAQDGAGDPSPDPA